MGFCTPAGEWVVGLGAPGSGKGAGGLGFPPTTRGLAAVMLKLRFQFQEAGKIKVNRGHM